MKPNWIELTLEQVCHRITDGAHNSPKSVEDGLPMASVKDLTPFGINLESCRHISEEDFQKLVQWECKPEVGDVLIAKDGNSALDTVCEVRTDQEVVLLSSVAILRPNPKKVSTSYLKYYLDCETTRQYLKNGFVTGAAIPRVILKDFKRAKITLPPLDEQRKISAVLSAYDDLIENNTRRIAILEEMAQALYREWFVRGQVPGTLEMGNGRLPEGWQVLTLGDVCESVRYGYTAKAKHEPVGPKFLRITDIVPNLIDWDSVPHCEIPEKDIAKFLLQEGDVVIARTGATVGYAKRIGKRQPKTIFASYLVCMRPAKNYSQFILGLVVESSEYKEFIRSNCGGAAQPSANAELMKSYPVIVPSPQIQSQFDALVAPMFEQREVLQHKNANLRQTRDLLLPRLISGELDISQLDIALPS